MTTVALQRTNMVESQVRPSDITDRRLTRAMLALPREDFAPVAQAAIVYGDLDVPLSAAAPGQPVRTLLTARVFAKLVQLTDIEATDAVLIVGAGMGYSAAVIASIAKTVVALESDAVLSAHAKAALTKHAITNVEVITASLPSGHAKRGPYNVIIVEGAIEADPTGLIEQLAPGGRLAAIVGYGPSAKATVWRRHSSGTSAVQAFDATATPLPGFARAPVFTF
jgi:protein-L-isoaspartate(D-aspartate) O-methyltransferase